MLAKLENVRAGYFEGKIGFCHVPTWRKFNPGATVAVPYPFAITVVDNTVVFSSEARRFIVAPTVEEDDTMVLMDNGEWWPMELLDHLGVAV